MYLGWFDDCEVFYGRLFGLVLILKMLACLTFWIFNSVAALQAYRAKFGSI
jgi:hypothetical protein